MNAWDLGKKRTKPRESELEVEKPGVYTKRENSAVAASKEFILALHYGLKAMGGGGYDIKAEKKRN